MERRGVIFIFFKFNYDYFISFYFFFLGGIFIGEIEKNSSPLFHFSFLFKCAEICQNFHFKFTFDFINGM